MRCAPAASALAALFLAAACTNPPSLQDVPARDADARDLADEAADAEPDTSDCVDEDGDGYGVGCAPGPDCDDADAGHHDDCDDCGETHAAGCRCDDGDSFPCYEGPPETEGVGACVPGTRACVGGVLAEACEGQVLPVVPDTVCNDADDDCDGVGDGALYGECGSCDLTCRATGDVVPDPGDPGASGLEPNPDGPGVVATGHATSAPYLWVANYDGTVSKLDLVSGAEVSRYKVGLWGDECDSPSRTAVDGAGNAYVASRAHMCDRSQGSVTKMAGDASFCIDRNRNDVIDTSTGPTPLPLNTDECVIWTARVGGPAAIPRGVAIDLGDELHPRGYPWVGTYTEMRAYKLDPGSGEVLATVELDVNAYGLAADGLGGIWVSGRGPVSGHIQRFDASSGEAEPPIPWSRSGCGGMVYGIAVDRLNRVWVADYDSFSGCAARWDPAAGTWLTVRAGGMGGGGRGIAVAADGRVWMALNGPDQMLSWNGEDGSDVTAHAIAGGGTPVGIGLDDLGHVWTVNQSTNDVTRLDLLSGDTERFPVGTQPYTYSDFTGYQRRVVAVDGMWTKTWERCAVSPEDHWGVFSWDVTAPPGEISLTAQSADSLADLDAARLVSLAVVPSDLPPVDVEAAFAEAGVATGRYLRVNVMLRADSRGTSPVFRSVSLRWHCNDFG